jgi:DNA-binding FadR family transcriptional regulator
MADGATPVDGRFETELGTKRPAGPARARAGRQGSGGAGQNLTYRLLEAIGRDIVTGEYDRQPFPTEAELAKQHRVSRSVTREAVKMLTAKGLLTARPRKGTSVQPQSLWNLFDADVLRWLLERKFSLELLRQFTELRIAIEPEAAALAARGADPEGVATIEAGYERMAAAERGDDDTLEADIAFHLAILQVSANPFYIQFRDVVETALRTSIRFTNRFKGRSASLPQHCAVLTAIARHDAAAAKSAMIELIADVMTLIDEAGAKGRSRPPGRRRAQPLKAPGRAAR